MKNQNTEDKSLLRIAENYWQNILANDGSNTGIREFCILNTITSF